MKFKLWVLLFIFGITMILVESVYTLLVTLFPSIAESKNSTALEYTVVFGIYSLVTVLCSPFIPTLILLTSPKLLILCSLLIDGSSIIGFGFVDRLNPHDLFIGISLVLRILQGACACTAVISMYALIPSIFPAKYVLTILGGLETCFSIAILIGPSFGTILFQIGGFNLPFAGVGGSLIVVGITIFIQLTNIKGSEDDEKALIQKSNNFDNNNLLSVISDNKSCFTIWNQPSILFHLLVVFITIFNATFFMGTIESYSRNTLKASRWEISGIVTAGGVIFGFISPILGLFSVNQTFRRILSYIVLSGLVVQAIGVIIIGSIVPIIPPTYISTLVGISVLNFGIGLTAFPSFIQANDRTETLGNYKTKEESTAVASSGYYMAINLGSMFGPPISGALYDSVGFQSATYFNLILLLPMILSYGGFIIKSKITRQDLRYEHL